MNRIISALGAIVLALITLGGPFALHAASQPQDWSEYRTSSFNAAVKEKKTLVVNVHADWCPTCRAQAPILEELRDDRRLAKATFVRVDWDKDKDFVKKYRIPRQSTIVVFRQGQETGRSIAQTDREKLRKFVLNSI